MNRLELVRQQRYVPILNEMLFALLHEKPDDPLAFLIQYTEALQIEVGSARGRMIRNQRKQQQKQQQEEDEKAKAALLATAPSANAALVGAVARQDEEDEEGLLEAQRTIAAVVVGVPPPQVVAVQQQQQQETSPVRDAVSPASLGHHPHHQQQAHPASVSSERYPLLTKLLFSPSHLQKVSKDSPLHCLYQAAEVEFPTTTSAVVSSCPLLRTCFDTTTSDACPLLASLVQLLQEPPAAMTTTTSSQQQQQQQQPSASSGSVARRTPSSSPPYPLLRFLTEIDANTTLLQFLMKEGPSSSDPKDVGGYVALKILSIAAPAQDYPALGLLTEALSPLDSSSVVSFGSEASFEKPPLRALHVLVDVPRHEAPSVNILLSSANIIPSATGGPLSKAGNPFTMQQKGTEETTTESPVWAVLQEAMNGHHGKQPYPSLSALLVSRRAQTTTRAAAHLQTDRRDVAPIHLSGKELWSAVAASLSPRHRCCRAVASMMTHIPSSSYETEANPNLRQSERPFGSGLASLAAALPLNHPQGQFSALNAVLQQAITRNVSVSAASAMQTMPVSALDAVFEWMRQQDRLHPSSALATLSAARQMTPTPAVTKRTLKHPRLKSLCVAARADDTSTFEKRRHLRYLFTAASR